MGCCRTVAFVLTLLAAISIGYFWYKLDEIPELTPIADKYWGKGDPKPDDSTIKPFKIKFSETMVQDLLRRLQNTRELTPPLEGAGFQYGFNSDYLKSIINFWKTEYNFQERETFLNQYPQFKTQISGLNIHFIHAKPDKSKIGKVIPLLLLHGWPGSVREFYEMIPLLITPRTDEKFVFEVIAPSLPGYGFSDAASKQGLDVIQMAVIMKKLMDRLGYNKFYIQGGDWGSAIGQALSVVYPENVVAYHSNMCFIRTTKVHIKMLLSYFAPWLYAEDGQNERISQQPSFLIEESGYMHIQGSKPDTVGVALTDSPAGLAAYILEKFSTWTNPSWRSKPDGGLNHYNKVNLLDNIMIYWVSGSITSSMRLYSEAFNKKSMQHPVNKVPVMIPTGCARFPSELVYIPRSILESAFPKLIRLTDMPKGGHFAAFEVPELLAEDFWQFVSTVKKEKK
ncbi:hypothetical protein AAG570_012262 [Ranatra chinensis]|uniref:Epoxide hydrolase n=1 Tax=Ranatra chinensis TaxID=642074 RepID=A0ABD0Z6M8_9HEMI